MASTSPTSSPGSLSGRDLLAVGAVALGASLCASQIRSWLRWRRKSHIAPFTLSPEGLEGVTAQGGAIVYLQKAVTIPANTAEHAVNTGVLLTIRDPCCKLMAVDFRTQYLVQGSEDLGKAIIQSGFRMGNPVVFAGVGAQYIIIFLDNPYSEAVTLTQGTPVCLLTTIGSP